MPLLMLIFVLTFCNASYGITTGNWMLFGQVQCLLSGVAMYRILRSNNKSLRGISLFVCLLATPYLIFSIEGFAQLSIPSYVTLITVLAPSTAFLLHSIKEDFISHEGKPAAT